MAGVSLFSILFLLPCLLTALCASDDELVVTTKNGQVQGKLLPAMKGKVRAFLGIPYGKPPVGNLRFRAPQPADSWEGVKDATKYGNSCFQLNDTVYPGFSGAETWNPNTPVSEDCLYVNVWTPRVNKIKAPLPVMVWIYGGGFTTGTASLDLYDGRFYAQLENVVVISMNYRVGAFGFMVLPNNDKVTGNAGLLDQRLGIQWAVDNAAAFGGDPSLVTVFGESAGSASVGFQLISPGSAGLFKRAVMQSGVPSAPWATNDLAATQQYGVELGNLLGCTSDVPAELEACMQKADSDDVAANQAAASQGKDFKPVVDGIFLPKTPLELVNDETIPKKEVLLGLNQNEGTYFLVYAGMGFDLSPSLISRANFLYLMDIFYSDASLLKQAVIYEYTDWADQENPAKNRDAVSEIVTDFMFICPVQQFAENYAKSGGKPFLYYFLHRSSINPWPEWMGVMHGYEIEFVFGRPLVESLGYTDKEVKMSRRFMRHWGNFARTGDPSVGENQWPQFTPENKEFVTLDTNLPERKSMLKADRCYFWNQFIPELM